MSRLASTYSMHVQYFNMGKVDGSTLSALLNSEVIKKSCHATKTPDLTSKVRNGLIIHLPFKKSWWQGVGSPIFVELHEVNLFCGLWQLRQGYLIDDCQELELVHLVRSNVSRSLNNTSLSSCYLIIHLTG